MINLKPLYTISKRNEVYDTSRSVHNKQRFVSTRHMQSLANDATCDSNLQNSKHNDNTGLLYALKKGERRVSKPEQDIPNYYKLEV